MGIAALVIGIVSIIVAFIPLCGSIAIFPAIIGLILGIVDIVLKSKENKPKGYGIAGTVLCAISIVVIILWVYIFGAALSSPEVQQQLQDELNNIQIEE